MHLFVDISQQQRNESNQQSSNRETNKTSKQVHYHKSSLSSTRSNSQHPPQNSPLNRGTLHRSKPHNTTQHLAMASNNKLAAAIFVLSVLLSTTMSSACGSCNPSPCRPPATASCPTNTLKLGACAGVLGANVPVGSPPYSQCCAILGGLGELEAAVCLCTAIKANVLGVELNWPTNIELILSLCNRPIPAGFKCA